MNPVERAYLGVSFRWRPERPDHGVTYDADGQPHTAVYVTNHGLTPARNVRFAGTLRTLRHDSAASTIESIQGELVREVGRVCNPAAHGALPLFYEFGAPGGEPRADPRKSAALFAIGLVEYEDAGGAPHQTAFCCRWTGEGWASAITGDVAD